MTRRVGILGGTFDPIHTGHLDLAAAAERALDLTAVLLIPAHVPPHRPLPEASSFHRFAMAALAVNGRPGWRVSDMELLASTRSFTSATLDRLHGEGHHPDELYFVIGADAFSDIASWKDYPHILEKARFTVVARPGHTLAAIRSSLPALAPRMTSADDRHAARGSIFLIDAATTDVSATAIRQRLGRGEDVQGLVPPPVRQHIAQHGLYVSMARTGEAEIVPNPPAAGRLHGQG